MATVKVADGRKNVYGKDADREFKRLVSQPREPQRAPGDKSVTPSVRALIPRYGGKTKGINGFSIALLFGGAVLLYSGVKGYGISKTLHSLLSGSAPTSADKMKGLQNPISQNPIFHPKHGGSAYPQFANPTQGSGNSALNKRIGFMLAAPYGWTTPAQWSALVWLWNTESSWNQYARNPSSGAYGIPQALPESKLPYAGQEAGGSSPTAQINWGLSYIRGRYGSPVKAKAFHLANGWY